ncbi:MAG: 50S ribosomal protein L4 [Deltaproteobacteria bacterium RBG_13_43_22]|jgi:large subunit ribosomal protein L4|nr:MAG: 50S ribosomal protein L4 [Deltaproteobacteria bacterium RBG_13_43_22]
MPTVTVYNLTGEKVEELFLKEEIFNREVNSHILHQMVLGFQARQRVGTASTKDRSEVRGGGRKPFRQKGTGRARQGTRTSPLMRKGGVIFGPGPRTYQPKINKKVKKLAMKMALSARWQGDQLMVLDHFNLDEIKTKKFSLIMDHLQMKKTLIITDQENQNLEKSARNVYGVKVLRVDGLNVYDILRYDRLVLLKPSIPIIEEALGQ